MNIYIPLFSFSYTIDVFSPRDRPAEVRSFTLSWVKTLLFSNRLGRWVQKQKRGEGAFSPPPPRIGIRYSLIPSSAWGAGIGPVILNAWIRLIRPSTTKTVSVLASIATAFGRYSSTGPSFFAFATLYR